MMYVLFYTAHEVDDQQYFLQWSVYLFFSPKLLTFPASYYVNVVRGDLNFLHYLFMLVRVRMITLSHYDHQNEVHY